MYIKNGVVVFREQPKPGAGRSPFVPRVRSCIWRYDNFNGLPNAHKPRVLGDNLLGSLFRLIRRRDRSATDLHYDH
jgi:hypothetical protein